MALLTEASVRAAGSARSAVAVKSALVASASAPLSETFDVFLSHSFRDAETVVGVAHMLERNGLSVYIDWREDYVLDREAVTPATAQVLRQRLRKSRSLVYLTSASSPASKWMPWELGYFDGFRPGHVGILPLVKSSAEVFPGQEYLGLYPVIENIPFAQRPHGLGILKLGTDSATPIASFVTSGHR